MGSSKWPLTDPQRTRIYEIRKHTREETAGLLSWVHYWCSKARQGSGFTLIFLLGHFCMASMHPRFPAGLGVALFLRSSIPKLQLGDEP